MGWSSKARGWNTTNLWAPNDLYVFVKVNGQPPSRVHIGTNQFLVERCKGFDGCTFWIVYKGVNVGRPPGNCPFLPFPVGTFESMILRPWASVFDQLHWVFGIAKWRATGEHFLGNVWSFSNFSWQCAITMNTWKTKSSDDASKQIHSRALKKTSMIWRLFFELIVSRGIFVILLQEHQFVRATKHHHVTPISRIIEPQLPIYFRPFITIVWAHLWRGVELLNSQLENGRFGIPWKKPPRIDAYHFFLIGEKILS